MRLSKVNNSGSARLLADHTELVPAWAGEHAAEGAVWGMSGHRIGRERQPIPSICCCCCVFR